MSILESFRLDGDVAAQSLVAAEPHLAHTALAQLLDQADVANGRSGLCQPLPRHHLESISVSTGEAPARASLLHVVGCPVVHALHAGETPASRS